jgi:hypothetical protein
MLYNNIVFTEDTYCVLVDKNVDASRLVSFVCGSDAIDVGTVEILVNAIELPEDAYVKVVGEFEALDLDVIRAKEVNPLNKDTARLFCVVFKN